MTELSLTLLIMVSGLMCKEKLLALYPDEKKFRVVEQDLCSGTLFTFGFKDNEHWYMHGVASSF